MREGGYRSSKFATFRRMMTARNPLVLLATAVVVAVTYGCASAGRMGAVSTPLSASFVVVGPPPVPHEEHGATVRSDPGPCSVTGRFEGRAYPRDDGHLDVAIDKGWALITRNNDKQWDDLHLRVEASGQPDAGAVAIVLSPTVDSAGPSLTTWQSTQAFHVMIPWQRGFSTRRLMLWLNYSALGFDGRLTRCQVMMRSDTLRFSSVTGYR